VIKTSTVHPARAKLQFGTRRYVFSRIAIRASSANNHRISISGPSYIIKPSLYRWLITVSRSLLQSKSNKRVSIVNTAAIEEAERQWRNLEQQFTTNTILFFIGQRTNLDDCSARHNDLKSRIDYNSYDCRSIWISCDGTG
jgi:hypothetical protein